MNAGSSSSGWRVDNPDWGYFRIRGEFLKVGHTAAATTIRSVLLRAGIPPAGRRSGLTWKQFWPPMHRPWWPLTSSACNTLFFKRLYVRTWRPCES